MQVGGSLSAHPLLCAVLPYVHTECIDECELFLVVSVNLVNQDPFTWFFAPPLPFPPIYSFPDSHLGHLRPFFFFLNLGNCGILLSRVSTFVFKSSSLPRGSGVLVTHILGCICAPPLILLPGDWLCSFFVLWKL